MMDMRTSRYSEEQFIGFLKQTDVGMPIKTLPQRRARKRRLIDRAWGGSQSRASPRYVGKCATFAG